mmetsp:Transcript_20667/g.48789  ORF Transcript_20667/g.48789 Transcript_20667/m.48789 type:complete len:209 (+) Transcript_20667:4203-4829(+)
MESLVKPPVMSAVSRDPRLVGEVHQALHTLPETRQCQDETKFRGLEGFEGFVYEPLAAHLPYDIGGFDDTAFHVHDVRFRIGWHAVALFVGGRDCRVDPRRQTQPEDRVPQALEDGPRKGVLLHDDKEVPDPKGLVEEPHQGLCHEPVVGDGPAEERVVQLVVQVPARRRVGYLRVAPEPRNHRGALGDRRTHRADEGAGPSASLRVG